MSDYHKYLNFLSKFISIALVALLTFHLSCLTRLTLAHNLPNNLITMQSSESLQSNIQPLIERQANAWETADADQIIADFAEDSIFIVPGSKYKGKQAIRQAAANYFTNYTDTEITIKRIIFDGNAGAVEWNWQEKNKQTGETSMAKDAIIFELENGEIIYWREYLDTKSSD